MNKKSLVFKSIALTSIFVLNVGLYIGLNQKATEVSAYSASSLPTTIDLNDNTDEQIRSYYAGLNSLDESERQGNNLLKNLKPILRNNQKYLSYDSGDDVWDVYCMVDRDWNKSPAPALPAAAGTYNSETNKIENYKWGNNTAKYENPYLHILYFNRDKEPVARAYGDHGNGINNPTGINREHIWPKGAGFDTKAQGGARGDIMHLWAAHGHTNNKHSNFYYGNVDTTRSYKDEKTDTIECAGNLLGFSKTLGGTTSVFEPQDSDKGDIARACFYMVARYNNIAGNDSIDSNNPNLELVNNLTSFQSKGYTSTSSSTGKLGILQDMLEWNRLDPPDEFEIHRNNLCYNNFTKNRNPFIDFPSWADAIWGTVEDGVYNPSVTTSASPATDPINTSEVSQTFAISASSLVLEVGDTAIIYGRNATSSINWTVDNDTVISLNKSVTQNRDNVIITALSSGTATITATSGSDSLTCSVTVSETSVNYGTLVEPLSVDEALSVIGINDTNATDEQLYVKGIVSSNTGYNGEYGNYDEIWLKNDNGSNEQALSLFRIRADEDVRNSYSAANSMVGQEVVVHGYGLHYVKNTTDKYEICKANNISPYVLSIQPPGEVEDHLSNVSPYIDLLATENDTRETNVVDFAMEDAGLANEDYFNDVEIGDVVLNGAKGTHGTFAPRYNSNSEEMRVYAGNTFTFTSTKNITAIAFTFSQGNQTGLSLSSGSFNGNTWVGSATEVTFSNTSGAQIRITDLSITTSIGEYSLSNVALRFGITIPKADWDTIHTNWEITDYGVMLAKQTTLENTYVVSSIQEAYENDYDLLDLHIKTYAEPSSFNENEYIFTVKLNMTRQSNYNVVYYAAPYIVANGEYYFLTQIETSVNDLAGDFLTNGGSTLSNEALTLLSTLH